MGRWNKDDVERIAQATPVSMVGRWLRVRMPNGRVTTLRHFFNVGGGKSLCGEYLISSIPPNTPGVPLDNPRNCPLCKNVIRVRMGLNQVT